MTLPGKSLYVVSYIRLPTFLKVLENPRKKGCFVNALTMLEFSQFSKYNKKTELYIGGSLCQTKKSRAALTCYKLMAEGMVIEGGGVLNYLGN